MNQEDDSGETKEAADSDPEEEPEGSSRRDFLRYAVAGVGGLGVGLVGGSLVTRYLTPEGTPAELTTLPRTAVADLSELVENEPLDFRYPLDHVHHDSFVVKLGRPAFGGVGPDEDIVAYNYACTHMGCPLRGTYKADNKIMGPCPCHFSTFDLTKRGIVVLGQATETLPQVVLELEGTTLYAVGVSRLIYGFRDNRKDAPPIRGVRP